MKALSIHPYYAHQIIVGQKSIECRTWKTDYRGDILICSTAKKYKGTIPGHALGVVELVDCVPFEKKHLPLAMMEPRDYQPGSFAWVLSFNRLIKPVPVKGKLSLWNYDGDIEYIPDEEWLLPPGVQPQDAEEGDWIKKYWEPLMV